MTYHSKEIWKDIQGYEGMYQVSSHGRVKSFKKNKVKILKPQMHYKGNEIFNSVKEAREYFGIKGVSAISECCNGKRKTAGIHPISKEKLEWEYYEN